MTKQHRNKKFLIQNRIRWCNNWKITEKSQEAEHFKKKNSVLPKKLLFEGWSPLAVKRQKKGLTFKNFLQKILSVLKELRHNYLQHLLLPRIKNHIPKTLYTRDNSRAWSPLLNLHFNYLILIFTFLVLVQINVTISPLL